MSRAKALRNLATGQVFYDTLHSQAAGNKAKSCLYDVCRGSFLDFDVGSGQLLRGSELLAKASCFIKSFYEHNACKGKYEDELASRLREIERDIDECGSYELTAAELEFGAKLAWRNAARCPGRATWNTLAVSDCRDVGELDAVFARICEHIELSTNKGNIRPMISVFEKRPFSGPDKVRIWNKQLLAFAAYEQEDGSIVGDKGNLSFTKFCESLGWQGSGGRFDILPIVLSGRDRVPKFFPIPEEIVLRVDIVHPKLKCIEDLGLQWFSLPAVSSMLVEVGGLQFPCAPFSGWYALSEVATRDLLDPQRYDLLEHIALAMGIEISNGDMLWKDHVNLELNRAVLHSFNQSGVTMVDQHNLSAQFLEHFEQEHKMRGGCPSDWVWLVSPESGSLTNCFHQEMLNYTLSPAIHYQKELHLKRFKNRTSDQISLRAIVRTMLFCGLLIKEQLRKRPKAFIYYATETGTARRYAVQLRSRLSETHHALLSSMKELNMARLVSQKETMGTFFFVVATFGNGGPPSEAEDFDDELSNCISHRNHDLLKGLQYAVLSLGSSQYPSFCTFGKSIHSSLQLLGGQPVMEPALCDQMTRPELALARFFDEIKWICSDKRKFEDENQENGVIQGRKNDPFHFYRALNVVQGKGPYKARLSYRHVMADERFLLVTLEHQGHGLEAGDHVAIYPRNDIGQVRALLDCLVTNKMANTFHPRARFLPWVSFEEEELLFYYDIASPLSASALAKLAAVASAKAERERLHKLSLNKNMYDEFAQKSNMDVLSLVQTFGSVRIGLNELVEILEPMRPRMYSVASSLLNHNGDKCFDLVLALVTYNAPNGDFKKGLCSNYLRNLALGSTVFYSSRKLSHSMVKHLGQGRPTLMIGAGSGIAPLRGIWQEVRALRSDSTASEDTLDKHLVLFGCREPKENLFDHETSFLVRRISAFSRLKGHKKSYVQQLVLSNAQRILRLVFEQEGVVVVCGAINMAEGVREAFVKIIRDNGHGDSDEEAAHVLEMIRRQRRYIEDVFEMHQGTNSGPMSEADESRRVLV